MKNQSRGLHRSRILAAVVLAASPVILMAQAPAATAPAQKVTVLDPIDPQKVQDQQDMTWNDYHPIPDHNWADPKLVPAKKGLKVALIAIDFDDAPFVITKAKKSDPFGNPQVDPVKRETVPKFYADFWGKPSEINHGQTLNGYWMEQSRGKYGITQIDSFGPYKMPHPLWYYGLNEHGQNRYTPDGSVANGRMEGDCDALWRADAGPTVASVRGRGNNTNGTYDMALRIYAGYDETGVWQEFGEMKFETKDDITPEFGNPNKDLQRWVPTRYVDWTSWLAGSQQWGVSSIRQGENSGTITHEISHFFFSVGDNNNNPYATPYRRVGSGPWDIMDRGSFNGPGGPHNRWEVPATMGASMPAGHMLRQRINFPDFLTKEQVLSLSREGLAKTGPVVATVAARAVEPVNGQFAGITVRLDGTPVAMNVPASGRGGPGQRAGGGGTTNDRDPWVDPATNPLSQGIPDYTYYSMEVVQRIGYDSFCPDNGVLLAKNKDRETNNGGPNSFNCFCWVIDAHPEDINMIDYKKPKSGTPVMRTVADYRQLNDALFHAGTSSGSQSEYEDAPNRLHFYVLDVHKDDKGLLSYTLGVRSLDGVGPQKRDVALAAPAAQSAVDGSAKCVFTLKNTGEAADVPATAHPEDVKAYVGDDIYRLAVTIDGQGWKAETPNEFAAVKFGESQEVPVFATHGAGAAAGATVTLKATSESDPKKMVSVTYTVK